MQESELEDSLESSVKPRELQSEIGRRVTLGKKINFLKCQTAKPPATILN